MSLSCRFKYLLQQAIRTEHLRPSWSILWASFHSATTASRLFQTKKNKGPRMGMQRPRFEMLRAHSYQAITLPSSSSEILFHTLHRRRLMIGTTRHRVIILTDSILRQPPERHSQTPSRCHLTKNPIIQMQLRQQRHMDRLSLTFTLPSMAMPNP